MPVLVFLSFFLFLQEHVYVHVQAETSVPISHITVVGVVYCDTCSTNSFSRHSYFLPGVDVRIQCKFLANSPKTNEQINFSVTRTTNKMGAYKLEVPNVDGVDCVEGMEIESLCQASLIGSTVSGCNVPGLKTSTDEITVKSKQDSLCIYSLKALSFRPSKTNTTLCGKTKKIKRKNSLASSKLPLPPFPFPSPPSLPFPFTPITPILSPPPPEFNLGDPRTWIPNIPLLSPPPPAFNPLDPRTWSPIIPPSQSKDQEDKKLKP